MLVHQITKVYFKIWIIYNYILINNLYGRQYGILLRLRELFLIRQLWQEKMWNTVEIVQIKMSYQLGKQSIYITYHYAYNPHTHTPETKHNYIYVYTYIYPNTVKEVNTADTDTKIQ